MPEITVGKENSAPIHLYYEDHGIGKPVVLIHGWPLSGASWEKQMLALLGAGHRVITYDRRGFGMSSQPAIGYEYETLSEDLNKLMLHLDLRDADLVGFSMGAGEVVRYLGKYGKDRVRKAVILSGITPYLLKSTNNPTGVDGSVFEKLKAGLAADRPGFLHAFLQDFYNFDTLEGTRISEHALTASWITAILASPKAISDCVQAWLTDFRPDVLRMDLPTLIMHGAEDRIVPIASSAAVLAKSMKGAKFISLEKAPHGILWTHADKVNGELVEFLR
ncbi:MAG: bromoperoxidase [Fibrobacteres bacterium]|nr:bromoperoxidase [Fibrobacterota bacterium]